MAEVKYGRRTNAPGYKHCDKCLANYPDDTDYIHHCDSLMEYLVKFKNKKNK